MATEDNDPGDIIYLSSGDEAEAKAAAATTKKRSLEDVSDTKSNDGQSSAPEPKRLRKDASAAQSSETDNSLGDDSKSTGGIPDFKHSERSFKMPESPNQKSGSWLKRFKVWVKEFVEANPDINHAINAQVAESAYGWYIDHQRDMKARKKKNAKQVAEEFGDLEAFVQSLRPSKARSNQSTLDSSVTKQAGKESIHKGKRSYASSVSEGEINEAEEDESESEAEYEPTLSTGEKTGGPKEANGDAAPQVSNHHNLPIIETHRNVPTGDEALKQQRRYFPSANDPAQMCLLCGLDTHLAPSCPTLVCSSCGSLDHSIICCPEKERCRKCRQIGHQEGSCTEKLALTKEEGLACVFCNSKDHLEEQCTEVWRSFHPDASTVRKVAFIPASCSVCGSDGHFSSDCKTQRNDFINPTWSVKNRDQYIDPECGMAAIEEATGGQPAGRSARAPELRIRGHAARTTNVHYSESDDSEVEFLGNKRVQKPAVGQIRMASNIQMPNTQNGRRNTRQNGAPAQPPLPPG
ncbi:protein air2, partial [Fusarium flagelliforme]